MSDMSKAFIVMMAILVSMIIAFIIVLYKDNKEKENIRNVIIGLSFVIIPALILVSFGLMGLLKL